MKIQYAVFCEDIDCAELPPTFKRPLSSLVIPNLKNYEGFSFPLFVTLFEGTKGEHSLHVEIVTPTRTILTPKHFFTWGNHITKGEIIKVTFQPDIYGTYIFNIAVDDNIIHSIPIPILERER